jgi:hypothetical protein
LSRTTIREGTLVDQKKNTLPIVKVFGHTNSASSAEILMFVTLRSSVLNPSAGKLSKFF